jgi:hypothetical protein
MKAWPLLPILCAASLAGCGFFGPNLPPLPDIPVAPPSPEKALAGARIAAGAERLIEPIEVSEVRQADSLAAGEYELCIRGSRTPTDSRRTYAVFFHNDDYKDTRPSVILDKCETQTYSPLPSGPAATVSANPEPAPTKHEKRAHDAGLQTG